jgi:branched-chain amino acid transport system permease protein
VKGILEGVEIMSIVMLLSAITYASILAIGCASITLLYTSTRVFNFAHASMVSWGFYLTFIFYNLFGGSPYTYMVPASIIVGLFGVLTYLLVLRKLIRSKASEITLMMVTLGVDFVFFGFLNILIDYFWYNYKWSIKTVNIVPRDPLLGVISGAPITAVNVVAPLTAIAILMALHVFLSRTSLGMAMRASIENPVLAAITGINVDKIYVLAWFIGGVLAGLSGSLLTMYTQGYSAIGLDYAVLYFAGSIVGGLYSILGGLLGGVLVGFSERLLTYYLSFYISGIYAFRFAIPLAMLIATLIIYPKGLAGLVERR